VLPLGKDVKEVVWSPDGKLLASRSTRTEKRDDIPNAVYLYSTVKVWDATTGKEIDSLGELKNSGLVGMGFSPDGSTLVLSFFRQIEEGVRVELWDARTGRLKSTIKMEYGRSLPYFAFSPDGKVLGVLYAGDTDRDKTRDGLNGGVRLFDGVRGAAIRSVRGHDHLAISVTFSPDGKVLATGGSQHDNDVRLWDIASGKELANLRTGANVPALTFSPDGRVLASGQGDGRVALWDVKTGKEVHVLTGALTSTTTVAFSPDGRLIAAAGSVEKDGKRTSAVRLWSTDRGQLLRSWEDTATSFGFTADGKVLAILGKDGVVRLYEVKGLEGGVDARLDTGFGKLIDQLLADKKPDDQAVDWLFVAAMGRFPEELERKFLTEQLARKKDRREAMLDVVWAIMNSKEYLARLDELNRNDPRKKKQ
jgi:WD40 repeat protein